MDEWKDGAVWVGTSYERQGLRRRLEEVRNLVPSMGLLRGADNPLNWAAEQVLFALDTCYSFLALIWVEISGKFLDIHDIISLQCNCLLNYLCSGLAVGDVSGNLGCFGKKMPRKRGLNWAKN